MPGKKYPIGSEYYHLYEEVGQGVSASVHRALCVTYNEIVAIKILDFERNNSDLSNISREAHTMILVDHPNVLKSHCSFVSDHNLWVVMPFMAGGSCLHILKAAYPDGFEEVVIATILREVLKGLEYLHHHGHIHRDVKSGNILVGANGAIKLGDFGVSACLYDSGDRQRMRNTFVGTPCWMAPEVMEQLHGYDFKADIWSFGITALELAHGHAPFSKYPPMKVLLMTLQNAPPGLDYESDRKFSKSFKQMIASCLVKDPLKRPSAKKLLKHSFFKKAKSNDYIARTLLEGLPTLGDRLKELKRKEEDMLAQKKMPDGEKDQISQNEYKRGLSDWNFNVEDMKAQAALIQGFEDSISDKDQGGNSDSLIGLEIQEKQPQCHFSTMGHILKDGVADIVDNDLMWNQPAPLPLADSTENDLKGDKSEDDLSVAGSICGLNISQNGLHLRDDYFENTLGEKSELEISGMYVEGMAIHSHYKREGSNGVSNGISAANSDDLDEKSKGAVVQQKGRFKVTSENVDLEKVVPSPMLQKSHSLQVISQLPAISLPSPSDATSSNLLGYSLFPQLHCILQTNILQRETILSSMKQVCTGDFTANHAVEGVCMPTPKTVTEKSLLEAANDREKGLLQEMTDLKWRLICAEDELQRSKTENAQV
ncbi:hypothetical protein HHK36_013751 [Tetracentron sinense]|uniref:Protein kinase domain-containing protein n=1 Tax=Tetracentron sinense TaxID=13715 RepID=A0A835DEG7_TETSI|nr:hypothetical protein HHK36_013751 [Tetracentron sinense]